MSTLIGPFILNKEMAWWVPPTTQMGYFYLRKKAGLSNTILNKQRKNDTNKLKLNQSFQMAKRWMQALMEFLKNLGRILSCKTLFWMSLEFHHQKDLYAPFTNPPLTSRRAIEQSRFPHNSLPFLWKLKKSILIALI